MWDDYMELNTVVINGDELSEHLSKEDNIVYIVLGVDIPYWDKIISVSDHWQPNSYESARRGKFDAAQVLFEQSGEYILAMKKEDFKKKWGKFVAEREEANMEIEFLSEGDDPALDAFLKQEIDKKLKNKNGTKESPKRGD